jgi:hypothetical protein
MPFDTITRNSIVILPEVITLAGEGFSEQEPDFILNYDIEYLFGLVADSERE